MCTTVGLRKRIKYKIISVSQIIVGYSRSPGFYNLGQALNIKTKMPEFLLRYGFIMKPFPVELSFSKYNSC